MSSKAALSRVMRLCLTASKLESGQQVNRQDHRLSISS